MSDLPARIVITEEGPREGFQIEPGPIPTRDKISLVDALSLTGVSAIQVCSFVSPRLVPGWADADDVVAGIAATPDVSYTALWFNRQGLQRAAAHSDTLTLDGSIHLSASEAFSISNLNRNRTENLTAMQRHAQEQRQAGITLNQATVMAAFGCNFAGDISIQQVLNTVQDAMDIAMAQNFQIHSVSLCDTMGWANPQSIEQTVAAVRNRWPDLAIHLHLHDTRGLGIANAHAGLRMGVTHFDTTVGGLGGCPFAKHGGAPGNIATEELVLMAQELGVETGINLDALIEAGHLAESIVGHPLPSAALRGGSLAGYRTRVGSQ